MNEMLNDLGKLADAHIMNFLNMTQFVKKYKPGSKKFNYLQLESDFYNKYKIYKEELKFLYKVETGVRNHNHLNLYAIPPLAGVSFVFGNWSAGFNTWIGYTILLLFLIIISAVVYKYARKQHIESLTLRLIKSITADNYEPVPEDLLDIEKQRLHK